VLTGQQPDVQPGLHPEHAGDRPGRPGQGQRLTQRADLAVQSDHVAGDHHVRPGHVQLLGHHAKRRAHPVRQDVVVDQGVGSGPAEPVTGALPDVVQVPAPPQQHAAGVYALVA
jgi:hypothetical protein